MLDLPPERAARDVVNALRGMGVTADHRGQTLRLSPGIITTTAGCNVLAGALAEAMVAPARD
jgi:hypothetical protein